MNTKKQPTQAMCPLDFCSAFDAYNYAIGHLFDENPLAVAIPADMCNRVLLHSLAVNGVRLFVIWSDELDDAANKYVYTTEAGAREVLRQMEENDKEAGVYVPDYWKVLDFTKYCK